MKVEFDHAATLRWANFSGDFNPIHFNIDMANLAGSSGLVVHGMLALLYVKQAVAEQMMPTVGWQQFKAMFRKPLAQAHQVNFDLSKKKTGLGFSVGDGADEYFKGICGPSAIPQRLVGEEASLVFVIDAARVKSKLQEFCSAFPYVSQPWIFIDALVFSDFLGHEFKRLQVDSNLPNSSKATKVVVQMSHRVVFDSQALGSLFDATITPPEISYTVARPRAFSEPDSEFGVVEVTVCAGDQVVLQEEIGLISREVTF